MNEKDKLPLSLPVEEAKGGVKKQAHFSKRPLAVDAEKEVWGRCILDGEIHWFPCTTSKTEGIVNLGALC